MNKKSKMIFGGKLVATLQFFGGKIKYFYQSNTNTYSDSQKSTFSKQEKNQLKNGGNWRQFFYFIQ